MSSTFKNLKMALSDMLSPLSDATGGTSRRSSFQNSTIIEEDDEEFSLPSVFSEKSNRKSSRLSNNNISNTNKENLPSKDDNNLSR